MPFGRQWWKLWRCRETGQEKCILFNLSGHGICDLGRMTVPRWRARGSGISAGKDEEALAELPVVEA